MNYQFSISSMVNFTEEYVDIQKRKKIHEIPKMRRDKAVKCIVATLLFAFHRTYILWEDGTELK